MRTIKDKKNSTDLMMEIKQNRISDESIRKFYFEIQFLFAILTKYKKMPMNVYAYILFFFLYILNEFTRSSLFLKPIFFYFMKKNENNRKMKIYFFLLSVEEGKHRKKDRVMSTNVKKKEIFVEIIYDKLASILR